jgi:hypothetical protein
LRQNGIGGNIPGFPREERTIYLANSTVITGCSLANAILFGKLTDRNKFHTIGKFLSKFTVKLTKFAVIGKKIIKIPKNVCQHEFYSHTEFQTFFEFC